MASRSKRKPRKYNPAGRAARIQAFCDSILAGLISGLIVAAVAKLLNW